MKTLNEYIKESLSLDMKLNETSLLDDFDDLEKKSDEHVSTTRALMGHYDLRCVWVYGVKYFNNFLNKKEIKKLNQNYNKTVNIYASGSGNIIKHPISKYIEILIKYIMSIEIYDEFNHLVELYKKGVEKHGHYYTLALDEFRLQKEAPILHKKLSKLFNEFSKFRFIIDDDDILIAGDQFDNIRILLIKK